MSKLYLIKPPEISSQLNQMIKAVIQENPIETITINDELPELSNKKIIFALELDNAGFCIPVFQILSKLSERGNTALKDSIGIVLVHSSSELYTKSTAQNVIFIANQMGCRFLGHSIIEATNNFRNFLTWQKTIQMPLEDICNELCRKIGSRLRNFLQLELDNPKIVVLHSSSHKTSNTLALWYILKNYLNSMDIEEHHVENGKIRDCKGCSFKMCTHYSKQSSCFYGGIMVEEIYPAIERADILIWLCPNYNDAISANLSAAINRLTALYRKSSFHNKSIYSIIVSGNSGSDSVAKQLIGALNINKGFMLPPHFALMATANDPGAIHKVHGIKENVKFFANNIIKEFSNI